jgi:hypothetical protein
MFLLRLTTSDQYLNFASDDDMQVETVEVKPTPKSTKDLTPMPKQTIVLTDDDDEQSDRRLLAKLEPHQKDFFEKVKGVMSLNDFLIRYALLSFFFPECCC